MEPMQWDRIVTQKRFHQGRRSSLDERSEFERDYDRIVYASPFRRLQDKAQVFPLEHNDFIRTRLTHSLEVSTLGRSLGRHVGNRLARARGAPVSGDDLGTIVATTCLAHDIGNPPFGHFGEDAIRRWFSERTDLLEPLSPEQRADFVHFDGNAQGLRILMFVHSLGSRTGLNLTLTTLASFMKYTVPAHQLDPGRKFRRKPGFFQSEAAQVERIHEELGLEGRRHPLAFLMEAADDIAYSVADIEDGLKKRVLRHEVLVEGLRARLSGTVHEPLVERFADGCVSREHGRSVDERVDMAVQWFRIGAVGAMFRSVVEAFVAHEPAILAGEVETPLIQLTGETELLWKALVEIARDNVYCADEVLELELYGDRVIRDLLERFVPACLSGERMDRRTLHGKHYALISPNLRAVQEGHTDMSAYDRVQVALDFICGMTDTYAVAVHERLNNRRSDLGR